ncbi:S1/P1 nuclease [candidate division KSB1 bacterium]|nr:S1/P1 nuclease [candidate division KSB1 bacterium]
MRRIFKQAMLVLFLLSGSTYAWNDTGHKVVSRIAWEYMTPQTRAKVIALLMSAPSDADLANLLATDARPQPVREREFFLRASTWADMMRDGKFSARREKYHQSPWHYINFFWESAPDGTPRDRADMKAEPENIVVRLQLLQSMLADASQEQSQRAIALAWVLHLVGDIHQPLHNSARVTATEPEGDRGGNLFTLDTTGARVRNLHSFWDGILNLTFNQKPVESDEAFINRIAQSIVVHHPQAKMQSRLKPGEFAAWAREGDASAKSAVYPSWLRRYEMPPEKYRKRAYRVAEPALALAGYRLAEMLNRLFAS